VDPFLFQEASRIFLKARRLGLVERDEWLERTRHGDAVLRTCVEAMPLAKDWPLPIASLADKLRGAEDRLLEILGMESGPNAHLSTGLMARRQHPRPRAASAPTGSSRRSGRAASGSSRWPNR
jgi:hypothetical protein